MQVQCPCPAWVHPWSCCSFATSSTLPCPSPSCTHWRTGRPRFEAPPCRASRSCSSTSGSATTGTVFRCTTRCAGPGGQEARREGTHPRFKCCAALPWAHPSPSLWFRSRCLPKPMQILSSCPRFLMEEVAQQLRRRCAWLASEEQREFKARQPRARDCGAGPPDRLGTCWPGERVQLGESRLQSLPDGQLVSPPCPPAASQGAEHPAPTRGRWTAVSRAGRPGRGRRLLPSSVPRRHHDRTTVHRCRPRPGHAPERVLGGGGCHAWRRRRAYEDFACFGSGGSARPSTRHAPLDLAAKIERGFSGSACRCWPAKWGEHAGRGNACASQFLLCGHPGPVDGL